MQHNLDADGNGAQDFFFRPPIGRRSDSDDDQCGAQCQAFGTMGSSQGCTKFKAVHMALIPTGNRAGHVLVWDHRGGCSLVPPPIPWYQRWAILDCSGAYPVVVHNGEITNAQLQDGDLFCSGHAWTEFGKLFVAGGTTLYSSPSKGNKLVFEFDPTAGTNGTWNRLADMAMDRWYPSVTRGSDPMMTVSGGSQVDPDGVSLVAENTTEHYYTSGTSPNQWRVNPTNQQQWFLGPAALNHVLYLYPHLLQLSNGLMFLAGPGNLTDRVDVVNSPEAWTVMAPSLFVRNDGTALIYPDPHGLPNRLMILGGTGLSGIHQEVEICSPETGTGVWSTHSSLKKKRVHLNTVILPDASIVAFGGNDVDALGDDIYHYEPERLAPGATAWELLAPSASERDYHSTAVLLPDGRVLTGGGDNRSWDYQIFYPPYFDDAEDEWAISDITLSSYVWNYRTTGSPALRADFGPLPSGVSVAQVVLMAPGSTTHHSDFDQRYVDLEVQLAGQTPSSVYFFPPANTCAAQGQDARCPPRGYYLVFLVSNLGVPYGAGFIRLQ